MQRKLLICDSHSHSVVDEHIYCRQLDDKKCFPSHHPWIMNGTEATCQNKSTVIGHHARWNYVSQVCKYKHTEKLTDESHALFAV